MKKVRIFLSRKITLERAGLDPVVMQAGANTVDADVAEHGFVRAHMLEEATEAANVADAALVAKVAELTEENAALQAKVDEQAAMLAAYAATEPAKGKK